MQAGGIIAAGIGFRIERILCGLHKLIRGALCLIIRRVRRINGCIERGKLRIERLVFL